MNIAHSLKALADDSRLRIVHFLSRGHFSVQDLTTGLKLSQSTISHHLKTLERAKIVTSKREGTWAFYSLEHKDPNQNSTPQPTDFKNHLLSLVLSSISKNESLNEQLIDDKLEIDKLLSSRRDKAKAYFDNVAPKWRKIREEAHGHTSNTNNTHTTSTDYISFLQKEIPSSGTLLELGCGSGALLEKLLPRKGETIGVDYSKAMIDESLATLHKPYPNLDLRLGHLEHLPLGDDTVDFAVACMVFHHVAEPREALTDVFRVMRSGAKLFIVDLTEHNNEIMRDRYADLWLGFQPKEFQGWTNQIGFRSPKIHLLGSNNDVFILETSKQHNGVTVN